MKVETRIKHDLEMVVRYFRKFVEDIEEYEFEYRKNDEKLDLLQDILANKNPFNGDLMEILYGLYEYEEDIKEKL